MLSNFNSGEKKKQIEEIAKDLCDKKTGVAVVIVTIDDNGNPRLAGSERYLKNLVETGYRKQNEGKWECVYKLLNPYLPMSYMSVHIACSVCGYEPDQYLGEYKEYNYCPHCGARMKGE